MKRQIVINNLELKELVEADYTERIMDLGDGPRKFHIHPLLEFATNYTGLCQLCAKKDTCEALGHAASLSTYFPVRYTVTACRAGFEPIMQGGIVFK